MMKRKEINNQSLSSRYTAEFHVKGSTGLYTGLRNYSGKLEWNICLGIISVYCIGQFIYIILAFIYCGTNSVNILGSLPRYIGGKILSEKIVENIAIK